MADLPKHLYKYRSWSDPLHRRIITDREIWFASPRSFNDPFDCRITMWWNRLTREEFIQTQLEMLQDFEPEKDISYFKLKAEQQADWFFGLSETEFEDFIRNRQRLHDARTGICTASSKHDEILMWSHYSGSHKGFCVEIDTERLFRDFDKLNASKEIAILPFEVKYPHKYPILIPLPGETNQAWLNQDIVKYKKWEYENEWRLITFLATDFSVQLNTGVITKVILGCEMPDNDQEEIIHELLKQGGGIALEKAFKLKDKFGLRFEPVEY